jgi:hypothetical protein
MLGASAGVCRTLVLNSDPGLGPRRLNATGCGPELCGVPRQIYAEQPTWLIVPDLLWCRFQRELGLRAPAAPLLAVVATTSCNAERLPWGELG